MNREELLSYLRTNEGYLKKKYHLKTLGIFGSFARGEANPTSDIDLLVDFEENTQDLFEVKQDLRLLFKSQFNKDVDICTIRYIKPFIKKQILSEAIYV